MRIAVVANGEWDQEWGKRELAAYDRLIAVDGGGNHIVRAGFVPDALLGDLDSAEPETLEICRQKGTVIVCYPAEKDETDLELALEYAVKLMEQEEGTVKAEKAGVQGWESQDVFLLGAMGGRIDHLLGNLFLLQGFLKRGVRIRMKGPDQELWLLEGLGKLTGKKGQKLSVIPITAKAVVRTEGLYYPLYDEILYRDSPRGISNVFLGEDAIVDVSEGTALIVVLSPDNRR
ncbi:thiamine pyrophosphokinase [Desulfitobacterium hafniense DCB-2]|uniref:Thiamine diphosphokinase n=1 Tax=Desulfitobacterium hafniense (strain DSM 10664 / DCB-2) TaxID=272564 RepID=B8FS69_DESHD|nr:thiamine diphosphokinase [Desulfitobacterium hafniense]ACL21857.1 thiamine pyrophosphokinase [Desulfitobacterium hafniense DCB-2]